MTRQSAAYGRERLIEPVACEVWCRGKLLALRTRLKRRRRRSNTNPHTHVPGILSVMTSRAGLVQTFLSTSHRLRSVVNMAERRKGQVCGAVSEYTLHDLAPEHAPLHTFLPTHHAIHLRSSHAFPTADCVPPCHAEPHRDRIGGSHGVFVSCRVVHRLGRPSRRPKSTGTSTHVRTAGESRASTATLPSRAIPSGR